MPEGDTIFRAARTLHRALAGRVVTRFESVFPALTRVHEDTPITGRTVEMVTARGKHLLIRLSGDLTLRTHMRMNGSWHIYRPGEVWQRSRRDMRIVLATSDFVAVGFSIPVAEWLRTSAAGRHEALRTLGPELLADDFDAAEAGRRLRERGDTPIADALLNQRVMAGIGNVYKSEVLFAARVSPFATVASLPDTALEKILALAAKFMRANVTDGTAIVTYTGFRRTTGRADPSARLWVYGRAGEPCRRCGTPVARATYWCERCQAGGRR